MKKANRDPRLCSLLLRLSSIALSVAALTMHMRSLRVFRWEQTFSGGVLVTFGLASPGLALCAYTEDCGLALQAYLCSVGAVLLGVNAVVLWRRWRRAGELTRVVAELLVALGVPLRRQLLTKVTLSAAAALALVVDLALTPLLDNE